MKLKSLFGRGRAVRYAGALLDIAIAGSAFLLSYLTIVEGNVLKFPNLVPGLPEKTLAFTATFAVSYWLFSMHRSAWRYVSIPDLMNIIKASVLAVAAYTIAAFLMTRGSNVPRSVPILTLLYLIAGLCTPRLAYRLLMEQSFFPGKNDRSQPRRRSVLLYGLNDNAESFIRANRRGARGEFNVAGILDDSILNQARSVQGVKVLGGFADIDDIVANLAENGIKISEVIATEASPSRQQLGIIVERTARLGIKASRIPDFTETAQLTNRSLLQPKAIDLGDLLGRAEITSDLEGVARLINNKVILVTGAGGSIGSELCRQIAEFGPSQLIVTDASEFHLYLLDMELREKYPGLVVIARLLNIREGARVSSLFEEFRPDSVFHAAALKHVPLVEANALEGVKTNLLGTRNVADAAMRHGATNFVMISTDKAVNPTNVMGATKRAAEAYCQSLDVISQTTRFKTVRFGNVLGSNGSVVPRFQEQISNGGPITVTHPNIVRYFMTIPEAVRLVLNASAHKGGSEAGRGKIMVLDMGKPVRIVDLAERMIQLAGFRPYVDIDVVFTGLRPGEKLYEELFDPSEMQDNDTGGSYFTASPRIIDKVLLHKTLASLEETVTREDLTRTLELINHIVPEYKRTKHDAPAASAPVSDGIADL